MTQPAAGRRSATFIPFLPFLVVSVLRLAASWPGLITVGVARLDRRTA